jgi:hypothetical protein
MIKSIRMSGVEHVAIMGEKKGVYRVLMGKPEENVPLNIDCNKIKVDLKEMECGGVWIGLICLRIDTSFGLF